MLNKSNISIADASFLGIYFRETLSAIYKCKLCERLLHSFLNKPVMQIKLHFLADVDTGKLDIFYWKRYS